MEAIEDIIAELREHSGETLPPWVIFNEDGGLDVTLFADRIEAAVKTLKADRDNWRRQAFDEDARANATRDKSSQVGNVAELREAVKSLLDLLYDFGIDEETVLISHADPVKRESMHTDRTLAVLRKAKAALSEPLKNCEVGTAEEQKQRFDVFCSRGNCDNCPFVEEGLWSNCAIRWAQMPYEEVK